jgi:hypothetical protein
MENEECECLEIEHQKEIKSFKINMARLVQVNYNLLEQ